LRFGHNYDLEFWVVGVLCIFMIRGFGVLSFGYIYDLGCWSFWHNYDLEFWGVGVLGIIMIWDFWVFGFWA